MEKQNVNNKICLETFAGGAFTEKVNEALMQVAENIQNPNTDATKKRQVQVTINFTPNKARNLVSTSIAVTTKLASTEAIDTQMVMGVNLRTGEIELAEYNDKFRGQMTIDDLEYPNNTGLPIQHQKEPGQPDKPEAEQQTTSTSQPIDLKNRNKHQEADKTEVEEKNLIPGKDFDEKTGEIFDDEEQNIVDIGHIVAKA